MPFFYSSHPSIVRPSVRSLIHSLIHSFIHLSGFTPRTVRHYTGSKVMLLLQEQQAHRMSCGPFSLNYSGNPEAAQQGPGVRSRSRRSAFTLSFAFCLLPFALSLASLGICHLAFCWLLSACCCLPFAFCQLPSVGSEAKFTHLLMQPPCSLNLSGFAHLPFVLL